MGFQDQALGGSEAHTDALRRLDEARDHQHEMQDALDASKETASEDAAATDLAAANEKKAAREAWVTWIERGY